MVCMTSLELWRPSADPAMLRYRAGVLRRIRDFFDRLGVLEVDTPVCSRHATTDPAIESFATRYTGPGAGRGLNTYLQTSPEFFMKRLLCAGSGPIYQICKVFRDGESGRRHNPEFTLLEWYRPGYGHHDLMEEVARLVQNLANESLSVEKLSYREIFERALSLDPHVADVRLLRECAIDRGIAGAEHLDLPHRDGWLDLLMTHLIEADLGCAGLTFIYDYPASQAALARISDGDPPVALRFELYWKGVELANGFFELQDAEVQRARFEADNRQRTSNGAPSMPADGWLLEALQQGLPECAGVALGIDRLLMALSDRQDIREVLSFDFERA
ncbi:MAG: EF-P lysine aminoacylase EpmA [Candidatus Thiodiazotropha sp.]